MDMKAPRARRLQQSQPLRRLATIDLVCDFPGFKRWGRKFLPSQIGLIIHPALCINTAFRHGSQNQYSPAIIVLLMKVPDPQWMAWLIIR